MDINTAAEVVATPEAILEVCSSSPIPDDMSASPIEAGDEEGNMELCNSEREASSERNGSEPPSQSTKINTLTTIDGKVGLQPASTVNGDALLQALEDIDTDDDSDLSDDLGPHIDRKLVNEPKIPEERFEPHGTDQTKIHAVVHFKLADGSGWYTQRDILPEQRQPVEQDGLEQEKSFFIPDLATHKVPERLSLERGSPHIPWVRTSAWRWERTANGNTEVWSPSFVFRRFNPRTLHYERIYVNENRMNSVDPNDKHWMYDYNKWIDQIRRRADISYTQVRRRDHWTAPEVCAMYTSINEFLHTNGVDAYHGMSDANAKKILEEINAAGGKNRGIWSLRGQMHSAHEFKNPSMAYLRKHSRDLAKYLAEGGIVSDAERFPECFIPKEEFPTKTRTHTRRSKKAKEASEQEAQLEAADEEEDIDEEEPMDGSIDDDKTEDAS